MDGSRAAFLALMRTLGERTAELHRALARPSGDPAFEPEPISGDDLRGWHARASDEALATLAMLQERRGTLPENVQPDADRLRNERDALLARIAALVPDAVNATKTRFHGDFHLGQVLLADHDFVIVDFEGEPSRPLSERRVKHSPLRDVAGMLRSFSYAAAVALDRATAERPEDRARLAGPLNDWRAEASAAFLTAYRERIKGASSYPDNDDVTRRLLQLFTLEKVLYELRYELAHRPEWVRIPLAGLLEQLATVSPIPA
jgi:maltose alpha-D-glucosyltransferase / alpha-amylase